MQTKPASEARVGSPELTTAQLPQTVAECHAVIAALLQRLKLLEERVNLDSRNSSKPPSSDGPASSNRRQRRASARASARKRGAQPGHKGSYRAMLDADQVAAIFDCQPAEQCECGGTVVVDPAEPIRHQVFDVPKVAATVNEYRRFAGRCAGCGKAHRAALPAGVPSGQIGQIGPRALALVGALGTHYHLTQHKVRNLLAQLMGVDFSVGAISQAHGKVAQALEVPVQEIAQQVAQAPVKHMDETRYPREGAGNWVWGVVSTHAAWYTVLPSRARYVATSLVGEQVMGILVSDRYAVYDFVDVKQRQVCWAYRVRHFTRISHRSGVAGRVGRALLGCGWRLFRGREQGKTKSEVGPQGRVQLKVEAQRTALNANSESSRVAHQIEIGETTANANVVMNLGDNLVLSDLSEKSSSSTRDGVPGLQDLPGIQYLFSNKRSNDLQRSVLILFTPRAPVQIAEASASDSDPLAARMTRLREKFGFANTNPPNIEAVLMQLQGNGFFREFRQGDVVMERWDRMRTTGDRLKEALSFLYY